MVDVTHEWDEENMNDELTMAEQARQAFAESCRISVGTRHQYRFRDGSVLWINPAGRSLTDDPIVVAPAERRVPSSYGGGDLILHTERVSDDAQP